MKEFEAAFSERFKHFISNPVDAVYQSIFFNSVSPAAFERNWWALINNTDHKVSEENKTISVRAQVTGAINGLWPLYAQNEDLEKKRVATILAHAFTALTRAENDIKMGSVPPLEAFTASGPALIGEYVPLENIGKYAPDQARAIQAKWGELVQERSILMSINEREGVVPILLRQADIFRNYLVTLDTILKDSAGQRVEAFLVDGSSQASLIAALKDTVGGEAAPTRL